ncbi:Glycosylphosphatidylinositol (GPI) anchor assembly protein [Orbilia ellipsospora]|uniref:Glycosylphosphatidylinositol (GPI) anchor assembly protein n=1 Tax=Orbilia ellipsospora TaxID=2528407 RepID=A0AAV9WTW4_9PEZI
MGDRIDFVQVIRHSHPLILLGVLYSTFPLLVQDPEKQLILLLPVVSIVQIVYASSCLGTNKPTPGNKRKPKAAAKGKLEATSSNILSTFLSLLLAIVVGTPIAFTVMVMLGAPITTYILHTMLSAAHLSLLTGFPLVYSYQVQGSKWNDIISARLPIDEVYGGALGACVGTWFGAIPIPLDWDREWQKWPITIIVGMYIGYAFGRFGGFGLAGTVARID